MRVRASIERDLFISQHLNTSGGLRLRFLLEFGRLFAPTPLPKGVRRGPLKKCYYNSYQLAAARPSEYFYCEGVAAVSSHGFVDHAWCSDGDGQVIDPTWRDLGECYFGVPFRADFEMILQPRVYGTVLESAAKLLYASHSSLDLMATLGK